MILNRIGVLSAGKIAGIIYGVIGLIQGAFMAFVSVVGMGVQSQSGSGSMLPFMAVGGVAVVLVPILCAIIDFVVGVIVAAVYNLVASTFGGLELEFVRPVDGPPQST